MGSLLELDGLRRCEARADQLTLAVGLRAAATVAAEIVDVRRHIIEGFGVDVESAAEERGVLQRHVGSEGRQARAVHTVDEHALQQAEKEKHAAEQKKLQQEAEAAKKLDPSFEEFFDKFFHPEDGQKEHEPRAHIFVRSVAPWETLPEDGLPRFDERPG